MTMTTRTRVIAGSVAGAAVLALAVILLLVRGGDGATAAEDGMQMDGMDMSGMSMDDGTVRVDPEMARALGINTVEVEIGEARGRIDATGRVTWDERRLSTVTPKFDGFVERLYVDFTGQEVRRGQALLEIYSPELVSAQEELLSAIRLERRLAERAGEDAASRTGSLVEAARRRLLLWDISPRQVREIEESGQVRRTLTLHAPFTGFVVEKPVQTGQRVSAGEVLYRLADLSGVWVEADVYERDLRMVREGEAVDVRVDAYPGERFAGRITYILPDIRADTRTATVRIDLPNPGGRVKPGMFASVRIDAFVAERAVLVPRDAVLRTGARDIVFVEESAGRYEVREVTVGADMEGRTQIRSGLLAGDRVVARAGFILDAESRLMETMMGQPGMPGMDDMEMDMDMDMEGM